MANRIEGDLLVTGLLTTGGGISNLTRGDLQIDDLASDPIQLSRLRVWDNLSSSLPATAAADDLALVTGNLGSGEAPTVQAGNVASAGTVTRKAAFEYALGAEYQTAQDFRIRVRAGMKDDVADTSCTLAVAAYRLDGDGAVGSNLVVTAAQNINDDTVIESHDFVLDTSGLAPGDVLLIVLTITAIDSASPSPVTPVIASISVQRDIRG